MNGNLWTKFEDQLLRELAAKGFNSSEMVPQLGRGDSGIRARAQKLGVNLNKRGRHYPLPVGDPSTWDRAQRLCAFANVPLPLAQYVVDIADNRGIMLSELRSESRKRSLVEIRVGISRMARANGYCFEAIGRALNRDHTTIVYHVSEKLAA
jgi:hypothetical protein